LDKWIPVAEEEEEAEAEEVLHVAEAAVDPDEDVEEEEEDAAHLPERVMLVCHIRQVHGDLMPTATLRQNGAHLIVNKEIRCLRCEDQVKGNPSQPQQQYDSMKRMR
jgi:hypothetical protein